VVSAKLNHRSIFFTLIAKIVLPFIPCKAEEALFTKQTKAQRKIIVLESFKIFKVKRVAVALGGFG